MDNLWLEILRVLYATLPLVIKAILIPILVILATRIGKYIRYLIETKIDERLQVLAWVAVRYVEKYADLYSGSAQFKKACEYVADKLPYVNKEDIAAAVEAAWRAMRDALGEEVGSVTD